MRDRVGPCGCSRGRPVPEDRGHQPRELGKENSHILWEWPHTGSELIPWASKCHHVRGEA